jgi:hypothetical protein
MNELHSSKSGESETLIKNDDIINVDDSDNDSLSSTTSSLSPSSSSNQEFIIKNNEIDNILKNFENINFITFTEHKIIRSIITPYRKEQYNCLLCFTLLKNDVSIIDSWLKIYKMIKREDRLINANHFLSIGLKEGFISLSVGQADNINNTIMRKIKELFSKINVPNLIVANKIAGVNSFKSKINCNKNKKITSIHNIKPMEIARALNEICNRYFNQIKISEFINIYYENEYTRQKTPSIKTFIDFFNDISRWVVTEILINDSSKKQSTIFKKMVKVSKICYENNDFYVMMGILSGLHNISIQRLKSIKRLTMKDFLNLQKFIDSSGNFKNYRNKINSLDKYEHRIPYLPLFITDFIFITDNFKKSKFAPYQSFNDIFSDITMLVNKLVEFKETTKNMNNIQKNDGKTPYNNDKMISYFMSYNIMDDNELRKRSEKLLPIKTNDAMSKQKINYTLSKLESTPFKKQSIGTYVDKKFKEPNMHNTLKNYYKFDTSNMKKWSIDKVSNWLIKIGLGVYKDNFESNEINGQRLLHIFDDLQLVSLKRDLGMEKAGHRLELWIQIQKIKK